MLAEDARCAFGAARDEAFFQTLADLIPQMVWTKGADGRNDYCNARFIEYMQCSLDEFVSGAWEMAHPDDAVYARAAWQAAFAAGTLYETELRLRPKGTLAYRWFLVRAVPYHDESGAITKWFGTTTDVDTGKRYAQEQETIASALSEMFVPGKLPVLPHLTIDAVYRPAEDVCKVGGDFYEALVLPDGRLLWAIGDVAGHGLRAAVTMGRIRNAIVAAAIDSRSPSDVLAKVNRIHLLVDETTVTALVGFFDPIDGGFVYASAGHPGPIVAAADGTITVHPHGGPPLGVMADTVYATHAGRLEPGSMLTAYTDGVTEFDRDIIRGEQQLCDAVCECVGSRTERPALWLHERLLGDVRASDDIAIMTVVHGP